MLFVFSGLPGVGKTTIAKRFASDTQAVYLRMDTIEQRMKDANLELTYDESYQIAFGLASENLTLGMSVVADSTNPVVESREGWWNIARSTKVTCIDIEVICTDKQEHRQRVESRKTDILGLQLPNWWSVCEREYDTWEREDRLVLDTANKTEQQSYAEFSVLIADKIALKE